MKIQAIVARQMRLERTNKMAGIAKITGGAVGVAGGVTSAFTAFLLAAGVVCPPLGVVIVGAGSVAATAGSAVRGAGQLTNLVKNRRRKTDA